MRRIRPWRTGLHVLTILAGIRIFTMAVALNTGAIISAMNQVTVVNFTKVTGKSKIAKTDD